ncbi:MAG TPA: sigma-70 family RNA polymerase sigma factor [Terracidiphilus sp.]|jgi:RNA polymerase sigma-70 factor (ECF subfamily)|nr:sigma-70 family RNA polymerase sigma factor [Terracidiphilus sp.]
MKSQEGVPVGVAIAAMPLVEASESLSRLFREHHRRVLLAAYRITGNMADAEDVAQSVFLRLATGNTLPPVNAGSYLYRAAVNGALDLLRRRKAAALEPLELIAAEATTPPGSSPDAGLRVKELRAWLRLAISELAPRAAEMFTLRYLEDLNSGEIAACMGTSRAIVAVTLHQARARLKKRLNELEQGKK